MKNGLLFVVAVLVAQTVLAENLIFKTNDKEFLIPTKSIEWLAKKPNIVEIGTTSGVFEIKNGKCLWIEFGPSFGLNTNDVFFYVVTRKKELAGSIPKMTLEDAFKELTKLEEQKPQWHARALHGYALTLIANAGVQTDFTCESVDFKPHDH